MSPPFRRILVANRGEIALRIVRAAHEMGMEAVAVYSDADATAAHVRTADFAIRLGPAAPADSYLRTDAIVAAAITSGSEAVHPGYGFLSERAAFARSVEEAGLVFVGPPSDVIAALGDKLAARRLARVADVPSVPGTLQAVPVDRPDQLEAIVEAAAGVGYPLLVKAAAGGGGRGIRRVVAPDELPAALIAGSREAAASFGDGAVYLEREIMPARHIEVQLLGDATGQVIALGERDCSTQRRHQKLIEEAPAPGLAETERRRLHAMAVRLGVAAGLRNAATVEFLYDRDGAFWFLEVNTRLQVEHPVTELVAGLDLVVEQFRLAGGAPLSPRALAAADRAARPASHAIEVRISAEDPARVFAPTPGRITRWVMPAGPGVRVDTAVEAGERVPPEYDPLICKLIVHAADRPTALARLGRALDETEIGGIQTTLPFHRAMLAEPGFVDGSALATTWVDAHWDGPASRARAVRIASLAAGLAEIEGAATDGSGSPLRPDAATPATAAHVAGRVDRAASAARADRAASAARAASAGTDPSWREAGRAAAMDRWPR